MTNSLPHQHHDYSQALPFLGALSSVESFSKVSEILKLLSDTNRLRIFWLLCHLEECVINISAMLNMSSPAVSHHLKLLKESGLILSRRDGKEVYYKASESEQTKLLHLVIEKTMEIKCPELEGAMHHDEQEIIIRQVHNYLMENLDKRITIDELSKKFLMNPTTLKQVFKNVYGTSLGVHIKTHRLEKSAELLKSTALSIQEIANAVGYESQSKFTVAFKEAYGVLPKEYRK